MTYDSICDQNNTTGTTIDAGIANPFGALEYVLFFENFLLFNLSNYVLTFLVLCCTLRFREMVFCSSLFLFVFIRGPCITYIICID